MRHARWLAQAFADRRYLRVAGRPLFLVYRPGHLPEPRRTTDVLREESIRHGLPEPYLIGINSHGEHDWREVGFDAVLDFAPQLGVLPNPLADGLKIYDYSLGCHLMNARKRKADVYPCVFVSWDNSPRRGENGIVFLNATPEAFRRELCEAVQAILAQAARRPPRLRQRLERMGRGQPFGTRPEIRPPVPRSRPRGEHRDQVTCTSLKD